MLTLGGKWNRCGAWERNGTPGNMALKTITVFCGSSLGNDPRFEEGAKGTDLLFQIKLFAVNFYGDQERNATYTNCTA